MAMLMEGFLSKMSTKLFVGRQKRFFKVIANGGYLAYFQSKPKFGEFSETPSGVYTIKNISDIERGKSPKVFVFKYNERTYDFMCDTKH